MPDVETSIEYLQKLPLYETEKPYYCLLAPHEGFDPDAQRLDNLEFETHDNIRVKDIRDEMHKFKLDECGFQVLAHQMGQSEYNTPDDIQSYRHETEAMLRETLGAEFVKTYEVRIRKNMPLPRSQFDYNDPLLVEGPARGAHSDVTFKSGPVIIGRYLSDSDKETYLRPGYRFRIVNTWRPLIPSLEDRPLALCDARSVIPDDLLAADRILPDRVGEVYYLTHNDNHQWYWLEKQQPSEPYVFVMYDTKAGRQHARFCPHVSFPNPRQSPEAPIRHSMETRSIVVTRE